MVLQSTFDKWNLLNRRSGSNVSHIRSEFGLIMSERVHSVNIFHVTSRKL